MRTHLTRRRIRAVAGASIVALALSVSVPEDAVADPNPEPKNPFYFTAPELPVFEGLPFELIRDPELPRSVADMRSGEPPCAAPPPLTATDDSSPEGYTLPVQIKITNGMMLAGYSPAAAHWGQGVPFQTQMRGITGWVNARVQLPSMKFLVDPSDVVMCDGARLAIAQPGNAYWPEWGDWGPWSETWTWFPITQPDGSQAIAPPGTFSGYTYHLFDNSDPGKTLVVENIKPKTVAAKLTGLTAGGALELSVDLDLDLDVVRGDHAPGVQFPLGVSGTFTTAVKAPFVASTANVPWDVGRTPPAEHRSYLPAAPLPGAVEGATTTVGSTRVDMDVSRLDAVTDPQAKGLAASLYGFLYGVDPWGVGVVIDEPDQVRYDQWSNGIAAGTAQFFPPDRGIADVSTDLTINRIGLPKGPPAGYGFD